MLQGFFVSAGIPDVWQLVAATMVFLLLPGPGTFVVLVSAAKAGLRGGFACLLGLLLADIVLMVLAAAGVAAVLHANPLLFKGLQYAGCAYLVYLGIRLVCSKGGGNGTFIPFSQSRHFQRGFLVTLVNPKAIVFYMAFFPLFIDPSVHRGQWTFLVMGLVICCCTWLYGSFLVIAGNALARTMSRNLAIARAATRLAGVFLIGFGIRLAAG